MFVDPSGMTYEPSTVGQERAQASVSRIQQLALNNSVTHSIETAFEFAFNPTPSPGPGERINVGGAKGDDEEKSDAPKVRAVLYPILPDPALPRGYAIVRAEVSCERCDEIRGVVRLNTEDVPFSGTTFVEVGPVRARWNKNPRTGGRAARSSLEGYASGEEGTAVFKRRGTWGYDETVGEITA
jgi:hypothetical protein